MEFDLSRSVMVIQAYEKIVLTMWSSMLNNLSAFVSFSDEELHSPRYSFSVMYRATTGQETILQAVITTMYMLYWSVAPQDRDPIGRLVDDTEKRLAITTDAWIVSTSRTYEHLAKLYMFEFNTFISSVKAYYEKQAKSFSLTEETSI